MHRSRVGFVTDQYLSVKSVLPLPPFPSVASRLDLSLFGLCFHMVRFRSRRPRLLQRSRDQIVTGPCAVQKSKDVVVCISLPDDLDSALILDSRQFGHQERLFRSGHVAIVDIEGEAG